MNIFFIILKFKVFIEYRKSIYRAKVDSSNDIEKKFKDLSSHAVKYCPYYQQVFNGELNAPNLTDFPILTKDSLNENFKFIKSTNFEDRPFFKVNSTSGSSGRKTEFYSDHRDGRRVRAFRGESYITRNSFMKRQLILWPAARDINESFIRKVINKFVWKTKIVDVSALNDELILECIKTINSYKPSNIVGYPSTFVKISKYISENKIEMESDINGIICSGEMLYDEQRSIIEHVFRTKIYNRYGCREFGHIASECAIGEGMHYDSDSLIIEIVDDKGNQCEPGEQGRILVTDLNNYVFPLIRYEIGDLGIMRTGFDECSCGNKLFKISAVTGRTFDLIKSKDGKVVSGTYWTLAFRKYASSVESFQIRQGKNYEITVNIKMLDKHEFTELVEESIKNIFYSQIGNCVLNINKVAHFEYSETGKFKWIISEVE